MFNSKPRLFSDPRTPSHGLNDSQDNSYEIKDRSLECKQMCVIYAISTFIHI